MHIAVQRCLSAVRSTELADLTRHMQHVTELRPRSRANEYAGADAKGGARPRFLIMGLVKLGRI